ncbi:ricin-type beta-trefoil lectin domain protein [Streptomyces lunaelactis]|uniref:ricin-type beta-trefoil lectin domain protein n=1 Tax=Streptomyces lunaelactis TaxID=1535768 RepID=UPI0020C7949E|nr:ricin-type beta-trefoil lectin domain protein [Streptomyces lunaelactis]
MERTTRPAVRGEEPAVDLFGNVIGPREPSVARTAGHDEGEALGERRLPWQTRRDRGRERTNRAEAARHQPAEQISRQRDADGEHGVVPAQEPVGERPGGGPERLARLLHRIRASRSHTPAEPGAGLHGGPDERDPERNARISRPVVTACALVAFALAAVSFLAFSGKSGTQARPSVHPTGASVGDFAAEVMPGGSASATGDPTPVSSGAKSPARGPAVASGTASDPSAGAPGPAASRATGVVAGATADATAEQGTSATESKAAAGRMIVGYASSRCIEVAAHDGTDGSPLRLWDCGGDAWQKWVFRSDGSVRSMGLCMDIANASTANGTMIQLARCNGGWAQRFTVNSTHNLVNTQIGKCVDVTDSATGSGARLQLWDCASTSNQRWTLR